MAKIIGGELVCPRCQSTSFLRIKRKLWMRLIPFSRRLVCQQCSAEVLKVARYFWLAD